MTIDQAALQLWILLVAVLWLKMLSNSAVQGRVRLKSGLYQHPEDVAFFGKSKLSRSSSPERGADELDRRAARAWANDLENIVPYWIIALAYVLVGGPAAYARVYFGVFLVARIAHSLLMYFPRQPHRNIAFQLGLIASVATAAHAVVLVV